MGRQHSHRTQTNCPELRVWFGDDNFGEQCMGDDAVIVECDYRQYEGVSFAQSVDQVGFFVCAEGLFVNAANGKLVAWSFLSEFDHY